MVSRITLLAMLPLACSAATVSDITFVAVEHSSAQIRFVVTGAYTDYRIRYIASPGTCTDGTSGVVNGSVDTGVATPKRVNISGLTSGGVYQVCPEVYDGSWSSGVGATLTLAASPAVSPDPPVAPTDFSTAMPDTSGCTVRTAATCGDIQTQFTAARDAQGTGCSIVKIPLGPCDISTALYAPSTAESDPFWVIVQPNVTAAELPPEGVRITPEWASKMATLNLPSTRQWLTFSASYHVALTVGLGGDTPKRWRFVGIRWTHDDTATSEIATYPTPDPHGFFGWVYMDSTAQDIIFDRNLFEGRGYPNRIIRPIVTFEGTRSAIIDSYFTDLDWWHSYTLATYTRADSTHVAIGADAMHNGPDTFTIPATTITLTGGTATGRGVSYMDMDGGLHLVIPGDTTATCSGSCTVHQVPQTAIGSAIKGTTTIMTVTGHGITESSARVLVAGSSWTGMNGVHRIAKVPNANTIEIEYWSLGESGTAPGGTVQFLLPGNANTASPRIAALPIGMFEISAGTVTSASAAESIEASTLTYEGTAMLISQKGPGPIKIRNNYISSAGLTVHFDDGCPSCTTGDFIFERNENVTPTSRMFWHADSDNSRYFIRHQFEVKNGNRVRVFGNRFLNCASDVTSSSVCIALTGVSGAPISDIDIRSNAMTGAGGTMLASATNTNPTLSVPAVRSRYENNLMILDAPTYTRTGFVTRGWAFYGGITAAADASIRRNTIYSMSGDDPAFIEVAGTKATGYHATDNFFVSHSPGGIRALNVEQCAGVDDGGEAAWECAFPGGVFSGNVVLATYTETTLCSIWGGTWADGECTGGLITKLLPVGGIANAGFYAAGTDFRKSATSPLLSGAGLSYSGMGVGADVDELRQAQGTIYNQRNIGETVAATVPDAGAACYVLYGAGTDPLAWTTTAANTDATRTRTIVASGLTAGMYFRVICAGTYQPASVVAR